jgi:hypothetical protein
MTFERSNKDMNIGRIKIIEHVLDVLHILTFEELHYAIVRIIKQIIHQGLANIKGNPRIFASGMVTPPQTP